MSHLISVADLSDRLDGEPRIRDLTLAERLAFDRPRVIRELIDRNRAEIEGYGGLPCRTANPTARGGRPGREYWLNEPQALLVCMFSRTPKAAEVRKAVIEVFMAWRTGRLPLVQNQPGRPLERRPRLRLTPAERAKVKAEARALYRTGEWRQSDLAAKFGVSLSCMSIWLMGDDPEPVVPPKPPREAYEMETAIIEAGATLKELSGRLSAIERMFYKVAFSE